MSRAVNQVILCKRTIIGCSCVKKVKNAVQHAVGHATKCCMPNDMPHCIRMQYRMSSLQGIDKNDDEGIN